MSNFIFHDVDTVRLAEKYGTPLYVVSADEIEARIARLKRAFDERGGDDESGKKFETYYASKAFLTREMLRILMASEIGLDVVSGGELHLAREMGFPPRKIAFHGNSKTEAEIADGLAYGVGMFVCDSVEEIALIDAMACARGVHADVLIRVTPGVDSHTHKYISTSGVDSKFGVPRSGLKDAVAGCMAMSGVRLKGFHFHVGSQLLENASHLMATDILLACIREMRDELGFMTEVFNMGGGFGVRYVPSDDPQPVEAFIEPMVTRVERFCAQNNLKMPTLMIEPGRWIVAEAGITLYTVGSVKEVPGVATYVGVDGGYPDNPRPALYEALYEAVAANRFGEPSSGPVTIVGKCCESGDILIRDIEMPRLRRGDRIAVMGTGAYNYSMSSNYNKNPIPAMVVIRDGVPKLAVRRQTFAQMYENDL